MNSLTRPEAETILITCLLASFADGDKCEIERRRIRELSTSLTGSEIDLPALVREVLMERLSLEDLAARLPRLETRQLAHEMAVCVCDADEARSEAESAFLGRLREAFGLGAALTTALDVESAATTALALAPTPAAGSPPPLTETADAMILRYAILAGALELLPQNLATLAIVPLQTKMVYRIGRQRGHDLDRKSIVELMSAAGLGLVSQVFEGFARRLTKQVGKKAGGKRGGKIGDAAGGMAMSFGTTYALGKIAKIYYDGGRSLSLDAVKARFTPLVEQGKTLAAQYAPQISERSQQLRGANLATLLKGAI